MTETEDVLIEKEMQSSYIDYAMSVIVGRALPDARDGLKPAQRRILFAMYKLGNTHDQPTKKSARVVGTVIGQYHPHGDIAAYETLVRLAQGFSLNHTLVQGQGNMGCFTKDTKIMLADGRSVDFEQLINEQANGKKHWGFAFNTATHLIEITEIKNPRKTRKNAELVEITLDNNHKIKCTPNHRFLLRDGSYRQAEDLKASDSLAPLYNQTYDGIKDKNLKGYDMVLQPGTGKWQFVHHLADEWNLRENVYAKSRGRIMHHKDFNKKNNSPDNIMRVAWKEHWELHYSIAAWRHKNDKEYVKKLADERKKYFAENHELISKRLSERNKKDWKNPEYRRIHSEAVKNLWKNELYREGMKIESSKRLKSLWKTKKFQELMSKTKSEEMKGRWRNEEYRVHMQKMAKEISDKLWSNPKHRELISMKMKKLSADPKWVEMRRKVAKELWTDPVYRAKYGENHFGVMSKKAWSDEGYRLMQKEKAKKQWRDHAFRTLVTNLTQSRNLQRMKENPGFMKELSRLSKQSLQKKWQDPAYKRRVIKSKIRGFTSSLLSKYSVVTPEIYESERKHNGVPKVSSAIKYFAGFENIIKEAKTYNHKVKAVVFLTEREDVYDLTTYPWHNFALSAGIFVHNSIDGDPPAAQRYTEVRLSKLAEEMLADLEKRAVPFVPNFDNTEEEPVVLPTRVPNLLINGTAGIAVGFATNMLPHNLREVCEAINAYVDNREITPQDLLKFIKGPDFPTGGTVFYNNSLLSSYLNGRGSCIIRGRTTVEENKGRKSIIIIEIPYQVNKATMVEKIADLVREKKVQGIADLRDESGKEGIRVVIDLKKDGNVDSVLNALYKHTQLQVSVPVINIAVLKNSLITFNVKQLIKVFVDHRVEVIKNRTKYDLEVASDRLHIVEGLLVAIKDINGVVGAIKRSADTKEARAALMKDYKLSEKQANAILDMKLSKLTALESGALDSERSTLVDDIVGYKAILEDDAKVYKVIKEETKELSEKYGRDRRTVIEHNAEIEEIEQEDLITDEETTIILTKNNYMKRLPTKVYRSQGRGGKGIIAIELREGDFVKQVISCMSKDYLLALTSQGRAYWLKAYSVPEESRYTLGKAAVNLVKLTEGERVEKIVDTRAFAGKFITFITKKGKIKRVAAEKFSRPRANGIIAVPMDLDDALADTCVSDGASNLFIATKKGKALRFNEKDVRPMGRNAHGVRGIRLAQGDAVMNVLPAKESDFIATITDNGFGKVTELKEYRLQRRGGKGVINLKATEKTGHVVKSLQVGPQEEVLLMNSKGLSIQFPVSTIRVTGRSASGVRLMRVDKGVVVVDAQTV